MWCEQYGKIASSGTTGWMGSYLTDTSDYSLAHKSDSVANFIKDEMNHNGIVPPNNYRKPPKKMRPSNMLLAIEKYLPNPAVVVLKQNLQK